MLKFTYPNFNVDKKQLSELALEIHSNNATIPVPLFAMLMRLLLQLLLN